MISQDLKSLMMSLNAMVINNKRDEVIWGDNLNGQYSITSGYFSLWDRMQKPIWAKAWTPSLTPKINIFFWLLLQDKILTLENLAKRGQIIPKRCSLCQHNLEMVNHLFIHFPYSSKVWNLLTKDLGVSWCPSANFQEFFNQWKSLHFGMITQLIFCWSLPYFYWGIWKE